MSGQSDMDTVIRVNSAMKLDAQSVGGAVPQPIQRRVDEVSTGWAAVQSLAILLQCPSASFNKLQPGRVCSLEVKRVILHTGVQAGFVLIQSRDHRIIDLKFKNIRLNVRTSTRS